MIKGTWKETSSKYVYYDSKGTKVYEETVDLGTLNFDGNGALTTNYDGEIEKGSYVISKEGTTSFLTFSNGAVSVKYSLVTLTNTNMTLSLETLNDFYYVGATKMTAAKSILSSNLVKQ